eukprot:111919-Pelagomonas_calceolata.AAC.6
MSRYRKQVGSGLLCQKWLCAQQGDEVAQGGATSRGKTLHACVGACMCDRAVQSSKESMHACMRK